MNGKAAELVISNAVCFFSVRCVKIQHFCTTPFLCPDGEGAVRTALFLYTMARALLYADKKSDTGIPASLFLLIIVSYSVSRILVLREDYDTVPVVLIVNLRVRTFSLDGQTVGRNTILLGEHIVDVLCATL